MIDNPLTNAARYGGNAQVSLRHDDAGVETSVVDQCPGLPNKLLPRLAEPFFRVEGSRNIRAGGLGLGLATVKAIVEAHDGHLEFENLD